MSLKKTLVGLTPIRDSDLRSAAMSEAAPRLGGLVEFYRSPARVAWTPTGVNVPDYPRLALLWWTRLGEAVRDRTTPQQIMDRLAAAQDQTLARLQQAGGMQRCEPRLTEPRDPQYWFDQPGAPKPKLADEEGRGVTMDYEDMLRAWREGRVGV